MRNCFDCGYILDGLESNCCPECGRKFCPDDSNTYLIDEPRGRPLFNGELFFALSIVGCVSLIVGLALMGSEKFFYFGLISESGLLFIGFVMKCLARWSFGRPFRIAMWITSLSLGCIVVLILFMLSTHH